MYHMQELVKNLDDDEKDLLEYAIPILRERFNSFAPEIIVPIEIELAETNLQITIPKIGDKKKLLELSEKNVQYFQLQQRRDEASSTKRQTPASAFAHPPSRFAHEGVANAPGVF